MRNPCRGLVGLSVRVGDAYGMNSRSDHALRRTRTLWLTLMVTSTLILGIGLHHTVSALDRTPLPTFRYKRIAFDLNTTSKTVSDRTSADGIEEWVVRVGANQQLFAQVSLPNGEAYLSVKAENGPFWQDDYTSNTFNMTLAHTQDYVLIIRTRLPGMPYALHVSVPALNALPALTSVPPFLSSDKPIQRITFASGQSTTTVTDQLATSGAHLYLLHGQAGQTLTATLSLASKNAGEIFIGKADGGSWKDVSGFPTLTKVLPETYDYIVEANNNGTGATNYTLTITIVWAL